MHKKMVTLKGYLYIYIYKTLCMDILVQWGNLFKEKALVCTRKWLLWKVTYIYIYI